MGVTDNDRCQGTPGWSTPSRPWADTPRATDHDRVEDFLRQTPEGAPVVWVARILFGDHVESTDKDWKFVKRHAEQYHRTFRPSAPVPVKTPTGRYENQETAPDFLWVAPDNTPREGVLDTASGRTACAGQAQWSGASPNSKALSNAKGCLSARRVLATAAEWGDLIGAFGGKRRGEERSVGGPEATRFNDVQRALRGCDRVRTAFTGARASSEIANHGVVVTATTAPGRFDSLLDAGANLLRDVKYLREKIGRGVSEATTRTPPAVTVPEPTAQGVPHAHVALFGVDATELPSRHALHNYWVTQRKRGQQVDVQPISVTRSDEGSGWQWAGSESGAGAGCPPRAYLTAGPDTLATTATHDAEEILAVAAAYRDQEDEKVTADSVDDIDARVRAATKVDAAAVRQAAWYWATGLKAATRPSPALQTAAEYEEC